jgi:cytoskeleton protein RodZ
LFFFAEETFADWKQVHKGLHKMEPVNGLNLGRFLKRERENKGLTIDHLAKVTRLRTNYIEALENEAWDSLPDQVFIKGFLKTYTRALGLDYAQVLKQFEASVPAHDGLPKPLVPPKKVNKKIYIFLIALIIFILLIFAIIQLKGTGPNRNGANATQTITPEDKPVQTVHNENIAGQAEKVQTADQSAANNTQTPGIKSPSAGTTSEPAKEAVTPSGIDSAPKETVSEKPVQESILEPAKLLQEQPGPTAIAAPGAEPSTEAKGQNILTCSVTETTYVKIWIDNSPPVQHVFPGGSRHQWNSREGFYILVGNAGGIEFDFNGKKLKDLGRQGEVVRLRLPDNFKLNISEN